MWTHKLLIIFLFLYCSCIGNMDRKDYKKDSNKLGKKQDSYSTVTVPFTGKRYFETRPGVSGTGTPHRQVEITKEGTVTFSFVQENQADKTITTGFYNAGKYSHIVRCVFNEWDDDVRFYKILPDKIYEVDNNGALLILDECCGQLKDGNCPCESEYFSF